MPNHSTDPQGSLQILLDKQAIRELKYRYLNACDDKSPEQVTACFAPGPVNINFGHIGQFANREDFVAVFVALGCQRLPGPTPRARGWVCVSTASTRRTRPPCNSAVSTRTNTGALTASG